MKKLFFILAVLFAFGAFASAQDFTIYKMGAPTQIVNTDTIANTGADTVSVLLRSPDEKGWHLAVLSFATNLSGTTDIDVTYQGSMDNVLWHTFTTDSLASGNLSYLYEDVDGYPYRYLRLIYTGVGTQSTEFDSWVYVLKQPGASD